MKLRTLKTFYSSLCHSSYDIALAVAHRTHTVTIHRHRSKSLLTNGSSKHFGVALGKKWRSIHNRISSEIAIFLVLGTSVKETLLKHGSGFSFSVLFKVYNKHDLPGHTRVS